MLSIAAMAGAVSLPSSQRHDFFSLTFQICDPPTSTQPPPTLLCDGSMTKMVENPWLPLLIAPPNDHCQAPTITSTPKIKIHDNPIVNAQLPRPPPNARPLLNHAIDTEEFEGLADPRLEKNYVDSEMFRMIEAAAACVRHSATKRPRMGQVVRALDSMVAADLTNGMRVGESEIFNTAEQSAEIRLFRRMAFGSQDYSTDFFSQSSGSNPAESRQVQFRSGTL